MAAALLTAAVVVLGAGVAQAAWMATGSGDGASQAGSLGVPTGGSVGSATTTSLSLSWSAPSAGASPTGYTVLRSTSSGSGYASIASGGCSGTVNTTSCTDSGLTAGTSYYYVVAATRAAWTGANSAEFTGTTSTAGTPNFLVTLGSAPHVAGANVSVTLTARAGTTTNTAFTGAHTIVWSGLDSSPNATVPTYPVQTVNFTSGVSTTTLNVRMVKAGAQSLTATEGSRAGTATTTVDSAGVALSFSPSGDVLIAKNSANNPFSIVVPNDAFGNSFTRSSPLNVTLTLSNPSNFTIPGSNPLAISTGPAGNMFTISESGANKSTTLTATVPVGSGFTAPSTITINAGN
jgi:hypothetical protein